MGAGTVGGVACCNGPGVVIGVVGVAPWGCAPAGGVVVTVKNCDDEAKVFPSVKYIAFTAAILRSDGFSALCGIDTL